MVSIGWSDSCRPPLIGQAGLGIVPPECDGCVVSTEFPGIEVNEDRLEPIRHRTTHARRGEIWL
jgi:hypothetical protein